jgi:hypothetical protein
MRKWISLHWKPIQPARTNLPGPGDSGVLPAKLTRVSRLPSTEIQLNSPSGVGKLDDVIDVYRMI